MVNFALNVDEIHELQKPINGTGGFQTLLGELQSALNPQYNTLELSDELLGKTLRYLTYGGGGFQGRLREAITRNVMDLLS